MIHNTRISAIAAIGQNRELGKDNKLLWHIPEDFKRFKTLTSGHPIIMGRKTFESIGRILPNRANIIITRDVHSQIEGAIVVHSLPEAIEQAKKVENQQLLNLRHPELDSGSHFEGIPGQARNDGRNDEIFIIGGGQIFTEAIEKGLVDRLYLTIVHKTFDADAFFPDYAQFTKIIEKEDHTEGEYKYTFITLEK